MLERMFTRRAAGVRTLLDEGVFAGASVSLGNGVTLPAERFAEIALDDLERLTELCPVSDGEVSRISWRQLAEDIDLLREVALARSHAKAEWDRVRT